MKSILAVDVESTCWLGKPPSGEQSEIIEIGVCIVSLPDGTRSQKGSLLIKPTRSKVSEFCTELTSITPKMLADGMSFAEACAYLREEYASQERAWLSWGNYDRGMFEQQCTSFGVDYPFAACHINLKALFGQKTGIGKRGMRRALDYAKILLEGAHHRGGDDAWNIAALLGFLLENYGNDVLDGIC
jgi:inhibitor of KinA sporulation pathway (predicted exonuclease)